VAFSRTSTTTSLCPIKRGIVEAWTGVIRSNPMLETASKIHSESDGVSASQAREAPAIGLFAASLGLLVGIAGPNSGSQSGNSTQIVGQRRS
jgi:hypothetical protein